MEVGIENVRYVKTRFYQKMILSHSGGINLGVMGVEMISRFVSIIRFLTY